MKLTPKQLEFLNSVYDPEDPDDRMTYECFGHERRTAMSLYKKGLVRFEDEEPDPGDETFLAGLTERGRKYMDMMEG